MGYCSTSAFSTTKEIDISKYNKLCVNLTGYLNTGSINNGGITAGFLKSITANSHNFGYDVSGLNDTIIDGWKAVVYNNENIEIDLSSGDKSNKLYCILQNTAGDCNYTMQFQIFKIWLEK